MGMQVSLTGFTAFMIRVNIFGNLQPWLKVNRYERALQEAASRFLNRR
jgi:hypothetical protein